MYIESITDTYIQYYVNDIEHSERISSVTSVTSHLFLSLEQVIVSFCMVFPQLSDNFCIKNCLMTILKGGGGGGEGLYLKPTKL